LHKKKETRKKFLSIIQNMATVAVQVPQAYTATAPVTTLDALVAQTGVATATVLPATTVSVTPAKVTTAECAAPVDRRERMHQGAMFGRLLLAAILIGIFTGLMLWYSDARLIMSTNESGQVYKNWGKLVGWAIGVGLLFLVVSLIMAKWHTHQYMKAYEM
jgi:hypothetical protein